MKRTYTVHMTHHMKSVVTVEAESKEEAMSLAYSESFDEEDWEESDTTYERVIEGDPIPESDDEDAADD